ncbi:MAG: glycosyl hydrolase [Acidimicrobiia bacterium]|nr:MAG: glycosyl hydrolase [Acidimicrobiia bacterium]
MTDRYPSLDAYAFIGDGHTGALVSRYGCIDWCCMPRIDSPACFARLLDWDRGGHFTISPPGRDWSSRRRYLPDTLILESTFVTPTGTARLIDGVAMRRGGRLHPYRQILRVLEGIEGEVEVEVRIDPRFEYGAVRPRLRRAGEAITAVGGSTGLLFSGDVELQIADGQMGADLRISEGETRRLSMQWHPPHVLDDDLPAPCSGDEISRRLDETRVWWSTWSGGLLGDPHLETARHSARVLKAMINPPTGAMVAAPTTSLPEWIGGTRNWDYRYTWIRDSVFAVRALSRLGALAEAEGFRRFVERTAAGLAEEIQVLYGIDGAIRLPEFELELEGYRRSRPVRVGNAAHRQVQLDTYGYLIELEWDWHLLGRPADPEYLRFVSDIADLVCRVWQEPDRGIWEVRGEPRHFVQSKAMCWVALDRAVRLASETELRGDVDRWSATRDSIREAIETRGVVDGSYVRSFGSREVDAALLLLPIVGYVDADDPLMKRTVDRIVDELGVQGSRLIRRYRTDDGIPGEEGCFLAAGFWLAQVLALQGRRDEAVAVFDECVGTGGDLGLFSEEFDPASGAMLGNYPQALTHLAHIDALYTILEGRDSPTSPSLSE